MFDFVATDLTYASQGEFDITLGTGVGQTNPEALYDLMVGQVVQAQVKKDNERTGIRKDELMFIVTPGVYSQLNKFGFIDDRNAAGSMVTGRFGEMMNGVKVMETIHMPSDAL